MIGATEIGTVWCFMNEVLEDSIRQLVVCLVSLPTWPLGTWLGKKCLERKLDGLHSLSYEPESGKAKVERNGWIIFKTPTRLCIQSWSLLGSIQWSGEAEL
jgi:hypothetical protein